MWTDIAALPPEPNAPWPYVLRNRSAMSRKAANCRAGSGSVMSTTFPSFSFHFAPMTQVRLSAAGSNDVNGRQPMRTCSNVEK